MIFEKATNIFIFEMIALAVCFISAVVGPTAVCLAGIVPWDNYLLIGFTWWLGDITGIVIITPMLLAWSKPLRFTWAWMKRLEVLLFFALVCITSELIFSDRLDLIFLRPYLVFSVLLLAAFRLEQRELITCIAIVTVIVLWETINGNGTFSSDHLHNSLVDAQMYITVMALTVYASKAALNQLLQTEESLRETHRELDQLVQARTEELMASQKGLASYRSRTEKIMEVMLKTTTFDFSQQVPISEKGDELDAIAVGINTMSEEVESYIQQLKESEEKFRLIIDNIKDYSIIMLDINGYIISWNQGAERIKGYAAYEIIGKHISVFYLPEAIEKKEPQNNLKAARENGQAETQDWRLRKDGTRFFADVIITAIYDEKNVLRGFAKITRDITEQKKAEAELKKKSEELSRSNAELEQFAYVASHDLQEPLRMISSYVQLLEKRYKDNLDADANDFINYAIDGTMRMRNLINSLLEYSRVNRLKPFEHIYTNLLLKEVLDDLKKIIHDNNASIRIDQLPNMYGDPVLISQLFQNLISNAIKFGGKENPQIHIYAKKINDEYIFSVQDNGIGIDNKYAEKIFIIFQRLHYNDQYEGTGIGLAICKKIVERHGGKIWVDSIPGKGSTFNFKLLTFA